VSLAATRNLNVRQGVIETAHFRDILRPRRRAALVGFGILLGLCLAVPAAARLNTGTYTGDGSFNRLIDDVGFRPDVVIVKADGDNPAMITTSVMSPGWAKPISWDEWVDWNVIAGLEDDGFRVSNVDEVNRSGRRYDWFALAVEPGFSTVGDYTGNGQNGREIDIGFAPDFVMVIPTLDIQCYHRSSAMSGDISYPFDNQSPTSNRIKSLTASGFTLGNDDAVNENSAHFYYVAWREENVRSAVGTYRGNDTDNRNITDPGFRPAWVMTKADSGEDGIFRTASLDGSGESLYFDHRNNDPNRIQAMRANGFQLGDDKDVNEDNKDYYWAALGILADLELSQVVDRDTALVGEQVIFTVTLTNNGPDRMDMAEITDLLPSELGYVSHVASAGTYEPSTGLWKMTRLEPDESAQLEITSEVLDGSAGRTVVNTSTITDFPDNDPDPMNNEAEASVTIPRTADLGLNGYVDDGYPEVGQIVALSVGALNQGPDAATGVQVTGLLPVGLEYVSHTVNVGSYDPVTGAWSINTLGAMNAALLQISARVLSGAAGQTLVYTPVIASDVNDPEPLNDTTTVELTVLAADLVLTKTVDEPEPAPGTDIVFRITLRNDGPDPAMSILVRDLLPDGLEYVSNTATQGSYDAGSGLWDVVALFSGESAILDLVATVGDGAAGVITNTASILASSPIDPDTNNNSASAQIDVQTAEIHLDGSVDDDRPDVGGTVTFSITAENTSIVDATDVTVVDRLPDGLTYVNAVPSTGTYDPVTGHWTIASLAGGASCVLQLTGAVDAGTGGQTLVNVATVLNIAQIDQEFRAGRVDIPVTVRAADLQLVKNVDDPTPIQGAQVVFSVLATNRGPDDAISVVAADTLPAGLVYISDTVDRGAFDPGTGLWTIGDVPVGDTATLEITAQVQLDVGAGDSATNTAWLIASDQEDPDPSDNHDSASLTQQSADLAVAVAVDDPAPTAGDTVLYELVLRNDGPSAAGGVAALDTLPTGADYVSHDPPAADYDPVTGLWTLGALAAGEADTLRIAALIASAASGATLDNEVRVAASDQADPDDSDNQAQASLTVRAADLAVALSVDVLAPTVGDTLHVDLEAANAGPDTAEAATLQIDRSAGLELIDWSASAGGFDPVGGGWTLSDLFAAAAETLSLTLRVLPGTVGTTESVVAAVAAATPGDPGPEDDADVLEWIVRGADLVLDKAVNNPAPYVGESVLYTLTLRNDGPDDVAAAEVVDLLPEGLVYVSHTPAWADYDPVSGLWVAGPVADDQTVTLFLQALVSAGEAGETIVNTATVSASDLADPDPDDNESTASITIPAADLVVGIAADETAPALGEPVTLTLTVRNEGPDTATGVVLHQDLPAGLDYVSSMPGGYDPATGRWVVGELAAGESAELVVVVEVEEAAIGETLTVTLAVAEVDQDDPDPGDESDALVLNVQADADLSVALDLDQSSANVGEEVVWTAVLTNQGPSVATGVALRDTLPDGVVLTGWSATGGTYDPGLGLWSVPVLAPSESLELSLRTGVQAGHAGADLPGSMTVTATDQADRDPGDNRALVSLHVLGADLGLASFVDVSTPNEGDDINVTLSVTNLGPDAANGVTVVDSIPTGLSYVSHTPPSESFTQARDGAWIWDVDQVESQTPRVLFVRMRVLENTTGQALRHAARVLAGQEEDPHPGNNLAENHIAVEGADLGLTLTVDDATPAEGDTLSYRLEVANHGANDATGVAVRDSLGTGLTFVAAEPAAGFDAETGIWIVGDLDVDERRELILTVLVDERTGGTDLLHHARVVALDQVDPEPGNDMIDLEVAVEVPGEGHVLAASVALPDAVVNPLGAAVDVFALDLVNWSMVPDTLETVTLANATVGVGTPAQLDASWAGLSLWRLAGDERQLLSSADAGFSDGTVVFADLGLALAPGDTVRLIAAGAASAAAHDGDSFGLSLNEASDLVYSRDVETSASWPLATISAHLVDGFVAAQASVESVDAGVLAPGGTHHLALQVVLPADGYVSHVLQELAVVNLGTARPVSEIAAVRAWLDDGDGVFSTLYDTLLGELAWTGDRWVLAGLDTTVPVDGARVMISVDAAPSAEGQRSVQLAIPVGGVTTDGGADGPLDAPLINPFAQVVSGTDRLWLSAATIPWRSVRPDGGESLLLHLTATNTFGEPRILTGLRVTGTVTSPYTVEPSVLDEVVSQLLLRDDADGDGSYTEADGDEVLGATSLIDGTAVFGGLEWTVPPSTTQHLFVTARLSSGHAADGDNVAASVASAVDIQFDGNAELAGNWPLGSGGLVVDGMLASAVAATPVPSRSVAPGEGPVAALDLTVPRNGHADDVLERVVVVNRGSAAPSDLDDVRLWRDGGDGVFDGGAGAGADDLDLGALIPQDDAWIVDDLGETVGAAGARLFVGVTGAASLTDSTTVLMALPIDGLQYASANDGPLDMEVVPGGTLLLSRAPLQVTLVAAPDEVIAGQQVDILMTVRNAGIVDAEGIVPSALVPAGDGGLALSTGPSPVSFDLAPGAVDTFAWTYTAETIGTATLTGTASGTAPGGMPLSSLPISTGSILVVAPAPSLVLTPLSQLPFAVNGGQTGVNALTLDLDHPGGAGSAAVRVDSLVVGLEDGEGQPVPAGGLLDGVKMRGDGVLLQARPIAGDDGPDILLTPSDDLVLQAGGGSVITLDLDIATGAAGTEFRLVLAQDGLSVSDVVVGDDVEVVLATGAFPVMSELTRVVDGAEALLVEPGAPGDPEASRGQAGVRLAGLHAINPGAVELDASIQLGVVSVTLLGENDQPLDVPAVVLEGLGVWVDGVQLSWLAVGPSLEQPFSLPLSTPVAVEGGQTVALEIRGDLRPEAPIGACRLAVDDVELWDARDANSGVPVPVIAEPAPLLSERFEIVEPASLIHLGGIPSGTYALTEGATDQPVLEIGLRHPAGAGTAPVAVDTLRFRCVDEAGAGLRTDSFMSRLTVRAGGATVGAALTDGNAEGYLSVPVVGPVVSPAGVLALDVSVDVLGGTDVDRFTLLLAPEDVRAVDAYLRTPVAVTADAGMVMPLSSGPREIRIASDELIVSAEDLMPAAISALAGETAVMRLDLANPAPANAGDLVVDGLTLRARGAAKAEISLGDLAGEILAYLNDVPWGTSGPLSRSDTTAVITPHEVLDLGPGTTGTLEIRMVLVEEPAAESISLGLTLDDISARQPEGELVTVRVLPAAGQVFPFWTASGTMTAASLEESYSNFPNPFAAGREGTTFVFALDGAATVDLRLYTPRGELVRTLLAGASLGAGLHQDIVWDGRNGRGDTVRNGVYVAELSVRGDDGSSAQLRRKVAVVR